MTLPTNSPGYHVRVLPRFPAMVLGANGIAVSKDGLTYTISLTVVPGQPETNDGAALGSEDKRWSDLFLANGAVINWPGTTEPVLLTHIPGGALNLRVPLGLSIQSSDSNSFTVGRNGSSNPGFKVNDTVANAVTGVQITPQIAGNGVAFNVVSPNTNENLFLNAKGTGQVITGALLNLTSGALAFPATQIPSTNPNVLDDYEEGTWTPTFDHTTHGTLSVTYVFRFGNYTKAGRIVTANFHMNFTFTGTGSGACIISGLPFAAGAANGNVYTGTLAGSGITKASYTQFNARVQQGTTVLDLVATGSGQAFSVIAPAEITGNVLLSGTLTYLTDT